MTFKEVDFETFIVRHGAALEAEPARNFAFLLQVTRLAGDGRAQSAARFWSADQTMVLALLNHGTLVLGNVSQSNCRYLLEQVELEEIRRLRGPEPMIDFLAQMFSENGIEFSKPMPQLTMELSKEPSAPSARGSPRLAVASDIEDLTEWCCKFQAEALPDVPAPPRQHVEMRCRGLIDDEAVAIWENEGEKVSMAAIVTRLARCEAVSLVYTPPDLRSRGYAGSVVAYLSKRIVRRGSLACLYVDARNPISARCYMKVGYVAVGRHADVVRQSPN